MPPYRGRYTQIPCRRHAGDVVLERLVVLVGSLRVKWCLGKRCMPYISIRVSKWKWRVCDVEREAVVGGKRGGTFSPASV